MSSDLMPVPVVRGKPVLTVVWIASCLVFAVLLLHPAVPGLLRDVLQKPNRILAAAIESAAHLGVFLVATQLALVCCGATTARRRAVIVGIALAIAVLAELAQNWVPGRGVDIADAAFNCLGVALAAIFYNRFFVISPARSAAA